MRDGVPFILTTQEFQRKYVLILLWVYDWKSKYWPWLASLYPFNQSRQLKGWSFSWQNSSNSNTKQNKARVYKISKFAFCVSVKQKTRHKNLEDGCSTRRGYFTPKRIGCRYWTNDPYIKYACTTPFTLGCLGVVESKWLVGSLFVCDRCDALWRKIDNRIKIPSPSFVSL